MQVRFYNAGNRIQEHMKFSLPEGGDIHFIGYWILDAPSQAWVEIPTEIEVRGIGVSVSFPKDIKERFGARGVVQLDPGWNEAEAEGSEPEKYPKATTEEKAVEKAGIIWRRYLERVARIHLDDCDNIKTAGGRPHAAGGFTKFALQELGIEDPYDRYFNDLKKGVNSSGTSSDVTAILTAQGRMVQTLITVLLAQASGQKIDPEILKAALQPAQVPETLTSGIATGTITKPLGKEYKGPGDQFDKKVLSKKERAEAAAAAL